MDADKKPAAQPQQGKCPTCGGPMDAVWAKFLSLRWDDPPDPEWVKANLGRPTPAPAGKEEK